MKEGSKQSEKPPKIEYYAEQDHSLFLCDQGRAEL
jgi:hypothetical protein